MSSNRLVAVKESLDSLDLISAELKVIEDTLQATPETRLVPQLWIEENSEEGKENRLLIRSYLDYLEKALASRPAKKQSTGFCSYKLPVISIQNYYLRLEKYLEIHPTEGIYILLLLREFLNRDDRYLLTARNFHRLLLTCAGVMGKTLMDNSFDNKYVSFIGGVPLKEYNLLEVELLYVLNFDFYKIVSLENYKGMRSRLMEKFPLKREESLESEVKAEAEAEAETESRDKNKKTETLIGRNAFSLFVADLSKGALPAAEAPEVGVLEKVFSAPMA